MLVPAWMINKKYAVLADWAVAFGTLLASIVALWVGTVGHKRKGWERRRNNSIVGAVIIETILEACLAPANTVPGIRAPSEVSQRREPECLPSCVGITTTTSIAM